MLSLVGLSSKSSIASSREIGSWSTSEEEEGSEIEDPSSLSGEIGSTSCTSEDEEDSELDVPTSVEVCTVDDERRDERV